MTARSLLKRAADPLRRFNTISDLNALRSVVFRVVIVVSALAALNGVFGVTAQSLDPANAAAVRLMLAGWAAVHIPLYLLERRWQEPVYFVYVCLAFAVLAIVFENIIYLPIERTGNAYTYHCAIVFLALLWLSFPRFVLYSCTTTILHLVSTYASLRTEKVDALVGYYTPLICHWLFSLIAAALLDRYYRWMLATQASLTEHSEYLEKEVAARDKEGKLLSLRGLVRGVEEPRQSQQDLRESEAKYRTLVEAQTDLVIQCDTGGRFLFVSPSCCEMLGKAEEDLLGAEFMALVHEEDREETTGVMKDLWRPPHACYVEHRAMAGSGWRWLAWAGKAVLDGEGNVVAIVGVGRDITERRRAEQRERQYTRDLEYLYRTAFEFAAFPTGEDIYPYIAGRLREITGDSLVVASSFDEGTDLLHCRSMTGLGKPGRQVLKLIGRDPVGMSFPISEEARDGLGTGKLVKVPGGLYNLALEQIPGKECQAIERLLGIGDIYAIGFTREGTLYGSANVIRRTKGEPENRTVIETFANQASVALQRMRAEEALRRSEEQFRVMFESSNDLVTISDMEAKTIWANPAWRRTLGYTPETQGDPFDKIHPDDRPRIVEAYRAVREEGDIVGLEYRYRAARGDYVFLETTAKKVTVGGSDLLFTVARDIGERKRAEEERRAYQDKLRSLASELALAEERERRYIATLLHDSIGQTLALSRVRLAGLREAMSSSPDIAGPLDQMQGLLEQAIRQTRSLTFELGSPILYEVGLEAAVERLTEEFEERYRIRCKSENDMQPKPVAEEIGATLFRAVRELLVNIVKHARASNVEVSMWKDGGTIRIDVSDDGVGFDVAHTDLHRHGLSGFGLFSIRERLGHFRGEIRVESGQGQGTRVTLVAPLKRDQPPERHKAT